MRNGIRGPSERNRYSAMKLKGSTSCLERPVSMELQISSVRRKIKALLFKSETRRKHQSGLTSSSLSSCSLRRSCLSGVSSALTITCKERWSTSVDCIHSLEAHKTRQDNSRSTFTGQSIDSVTGGRQQQVTRHQHALSAFNYTQDGWSSLVAFTGRPSAAARMPTHGSARSIYTVSRLP